MLIARAMFAETELLILDEPAAGLDLPGRESLIATLESMTRRADGPTTVLATHHVEEVPSSTTHAALLRDGLLTATGAVEEVLTSAQLRGCFGLDVHVGRRNGRWWAALARPDRISPGDVPEPLG